MTALPSACDKCGGSFRKSGTSARVGVIVAGGALALAAFYFSGSELAAGMFIVAAMAVAAVLESRADLVAASGIAIWRSRGMLLLLLTLAIAWILFAVSTP